MKDTKDIVVLYLDRGLFCESAIRMAKDVKRVFYHCFNNADPFPVLNASIIGHGMEGIEVVDSIFGKHFDEADLIVCPDVGDGELQEHCLSLGKKVWGAKMGCELEQDRPYFKDMLESVGLPVGPHKIIKGVKNLRAYLKEHDNQFVKVSRYRGSTESFHATSYKDVEPHLDEMEFKLGPLKEMMIFDVEEALPNKCEVGIDDWCVGGKSPETVSAGLEDKDRCYVMRWQKKSELPKPLREVNDKMHPMLCDHDYRGFVSSEVRIGKDGKPYFIDISCRHGHPPGFLQMYMLKNYSDIIWRGANGECVEPEFDHAYGIQLHIKSAWADREQWQPIYFDPRNRDQIKIVNPCRINGTYYCVPLRFGISACASIVGSGDSIEAARKSVEKAAKGIEGYMLDIDFAAIDDALDSLEDAKAMNVNLNIV